MKQTILTIAALLAFNLGFSQTINHTEPDKLLWKSPSVGIPLYTLERVERYGGVYISFYFDDKTYDYINSIGGTLFREEKADTFFNNCLKMLEDPNEDGKIISMSMNDLYVERYTNIYGFPSLLIYDGKKYTTIGKSKIKQIIKALQ